MREIYYNPKEWASFGGVKRLAKSSKVKQSVARNWLSQQDAYTLHFPVRYKFSRRQTIAYGVNELWQADLVDMQKHARYNKGFRYILTVIDVMSRFLRAIPVKNKKASTIADAFKNIFKQVKPLNLQTDDGTEFFNATIQRLMKKHNIHHYSTKSGHKCAILERSHRSLRNRMYRIFTYRNNYTYIDVLQDLVNSYNNTVHSSHGYKPANVTTADEAEIYKRLYSYSKIDKFRFEVGDLVRISKANRVFRKGYLPGWTEEVFKILKRYPTTPHTYVLCDLNGKEIDGRFYNEELQKI